MKSKMAAVVALIFIFSIGSLIGFYSRPKDIEDAWDFVPGEGAWIGFVGIAIIALIGLLKANKWAEEEKWEKEQGDKYLRDRGCCPLGGDCPVKRKQEEDL